MIARIWSGRAEKDRVPAYLDHFDKEVLPRLEAIEGFRGAHVLRLEVEDLVEFTVMTFWESMEAVRSFAGDDPDHAVVAPAAAGILHDWDEHVRHHEVLRTTR